MVILRHENFFITLEIKDILMKDIKAFHEINQRLREFFVERGYVEVPAQSRRSILAACENPKSIASYKIQGVEWPLPQTGQMWLEIELLNNPKLEGVFCQTTSYRDEKEPIEGRHDIIFPMFEFESKGGMDKMTELEGELTKHLGFKGKKFLRYEDACEKYGVKILEDREEGKMKNDYGNVVFLSHFPHRTSPFWNMRHIRDGIYAKVDVILHGMETIGSAERSCDVDGMRMNFKIISDGEYAKELYRFGKERVMKELDDYLSLKMFPRFGGGIGMTRLARAMELEGLL